MGVINEQITIWRPPVWIASLAPMRLLDDTYKWYDPERYISVDDFVSTRKQAMPEADQNADPKDGGGGRREWKWPHPKANTEHDGVPENSPQWRNLSLIFEWVILRATITLHDINRALFDNVNQPLE